MPCSRHPCRFLRALGPALYLPCSRNPAPRCREQKPSRRGGLRRELPPVSTPTPSRSLSLLSPAPFSKWGGGRSRRPVLRNGLQLTLGVEVCAYPKWAIFRAGNYIVEAPATSDIRPGHQPPKRRDQKPRFLRALSSASRRTRSSTRADFSSASSRCSWIRRSLSVSSLTLSSSRVEMVFSWSSRWNST